MPDDTSPTRLRVFLCHWSGDKPTVKALYRKLSLDGFDPWLDEEKLLPGQNWDKEIQLAVRNSDIVVACFSNASITRKGYIQKELKFALDIAEEQPEGTIFIIPTKLEECEIPERLNGLQCVNLFRPNGYYRLVQSLKHRVETGVTNRSGSDQKSNQKSLLESNEINSADSSSKHSREQRFKEIQHEELPTEASRESSPGHSLSKAKLRYFTTRQGIVVTLITLVTLVIAYWQFPKTQGTFDQVQYTGRVIHAITHHPIANAKISVEIQGPPQVHYTDSEGVFNLKLPKTIDSAHIRVEAEGYELFDRNISVSRAGIEYVPLNPIPIASPTSTPSSPEREQVRSASTPQSQRRRKVPCSAEDKLIGKCSE